MVALELPKNLVAISRTTRHADLPRWVADLPGIVAHVAAMWSLRLDPPYQPGGQTAWVAPAIDPSGDDLVLKVGWSHDEARDEAAGLLAWQGDGAVRIHASWTDGRTSALLLERCSPGTPLDRVVPELERDEVVAGLLRRLWRSPAADHRFRSLASMCAHWADVFETLPAVPGALDPGLVRAGLELWRALPSDAEREVLLVTDLHAENVLAAQREPWLVVDPKPYVGDPTYDPLQHMLNCDARLRADPLDLVARMAGLLDLDPERLRTWLFARAVVECLDQPWLVEVARRVAPP